MMSRSFLGLALVALFLSAQAINADSYSSSSCDSSSCDSHHHHCHGDHCHTEPSYHEPEPECHEPSCHSEPSYHEPEPSYHSEPSYHEPEPECHESSCHSEPSYHEPSYHAPEPSYHEPSYHEPEPEYPVPTPNYETGYDYEHSPSTGNYDYSLATIPSTIGELVYLDFSIISRAVKGTVKAALNLVFGVQKIIFKTNNKLTSLRKKAAKHIKKALKMCTNKKYKKPNFFLGLLRLKMTPKRLLKKLTDDVTRITKLDEVIMGAFDSLTNAINSCDESVGNSDYVVKMKESSYAICELNHKADMGLLSALEAAINRLTAFISSSYGKNGYNYDAGYGYDNHHSYSSSSSY